MPAAHAQLVVHPKSIPNSYQNNKIVKQSDIKTYQFLGNVIRKHPSAYVKQTGFHGQLSQVSFRGLPSSHTLVLLDGIPLNSSSSGLFDFSILQSKSIDFINIIPGSSSVLYGGHATGGVLELTSHQATKNQKKFQAEGGSFNTCNGYAGIDTTYKKGNYTVYTEGYRTDGLPKYEKSRIYGERGKTSNGGGGAYLNHSFRKVDVSLFLKNNSANLKYDPGLNIPPKPQGNQYRNVSMMGTKLSGNSHQYQCQHELLVALFNDYTNYQGDSFADHTKYYNKYDLGIYAMKDGETNIHFSTDHEKLKQAGNFNKHVTNIGTAISHNHMILQNLFIDLGVRNDHHKLYKNHQTYSSGLHYKYGQSTIFVSYRTGFRPPTIYGLYFENHRVEANRTLNPEKSVSLEMGIKNRVTKNYQIHLNFYQSKTRNFIVGKLLANGKWKEENRAGTTRINGMDFIQNLILNKKLNFSLGYSLTNFDHRDTGVADGIPRHKITGSINWKISEDLQSQLSAQWISNRRSNHTILRNYTLVDFNLTKSLNASSEIYVKMNNVFDERYTAVRNFRSPRREVYIGTILIF
jgi:vitamin B12 transporter